MKLTEQQLLGLLKAVGLKDVELVEDEKESDFEEDAAIDIIDTSRQPIIETRIEGTIKETTEKAIIGKANGSLRSVFARVFGVDKKALTETMTFEEMASTAANHFKSTLSDDKLEHQKQIDEILQAREDALTMKEQEWSAKYGQLNEKYIKRDRIETLSKSFDKAPFPEDYDRMTGMQDFDSYLNQNYHVVFDEENKAINLFEKNNPDKVAMNSSKNQKITLNELGEQYFTPRGAWKKNLAHVDVDKMPPGQPYTPQGGEQNKRPTTAIKAQNAMEAYINS